MRLTTCRHCGAFIDPALGEVAPTGDTTEGTRDDPRAPGDWDDVCDLCGYGRDLPGGPKADALYGVGGGAAAAIRWG